MMIELRTDAEIQKPGTAWLRRDERKSDNYLGQLG